MSRALGTLGRRAGALRRISRASSRAKPLLTVTGPTPEVVATAEERAFARLMAVLSISFVVCWMPQMVRRICFYYFLKKKKEKKNICSSLFLSLSVSKIISSPLF